MLLGLTWLQHVTLFNMWQRLTWLCDSVQHVQHVQVFNMSFMCKCSICTVFNMCKSSTCTCFQHCTITSFQGSPHNFQHLSNWTAHSFQFNNTVTQFLILLQVDFCILHATLLNQSRFHILPANNSWHCKIAYGRAQVEKILLC